MAEQDKTVAEIASLKVPSSYINNDVINPDLLTVDPSAPLPSPPKTVSALAATSPSTRDPTTTIPSKITPLTTRPSPPYSRPLPPPPPSKKQIEAPFIERTLEIKHLITHSPDTFLSELAFIILDMRHAFIIARVRWRGGQTEGLLDLWDRIRQFRGMGIREDRYMGGVMYEEFEITECRGGWGRPKQREHHEDGV